MAMRHSNIDPADLDAVEAKNDLAKTEALLKLLERENFACSIEVCELKVSLCNISKVIPALEYHKNEIIKFLNNEPNEWE